HAVLSEAARPRIRFTRKWGTAKSLATLTSKLSREPRRCKSRVEGPQEPNIVHPHEISVGGVDVGRRAGRQNSAGRPQLLLKRDILLLPRGGIDGPPSPRKLLRPLRARPEAEVADRIWHEVSGGGNRPIPVGDRQTGDHALVCGARDI